MRFYDRPLEDRIELTQRAIAERRTLMERWSAMDESESSPWNARAALAGTMLVGCTSVADIGCGQMQLRQHLAQGVRYVPVDVVPRGPGSIVLDLNREPLPDLQVDAYALLGVLEYLHDVRPILAGLKGKIVTSYNPVDLSDQQRAGHGWVNSYRTNELEAIFLDAGLTVQATEVLGAQRLWKLHRGT